MENKETQEVGMITIERWVVPYNGVKGTAPLEKIVELQSAVTAAVDATVASLKKHGMWPISVPCEGATKAETELEKPKVPYCNKHDCFFAKHTKGGKTWYSHVDKGSETGWCNLKEEE